MPSKNKIDQRLKEYIKEHLSKGYSKKAVKHVLVNHGYDENYVDKLTGKYSELQFIKKYSIIVSLLFTILFFSFNLIELRETQITGYATTISTSNEGCCTPICQQTSKNECYGNFISDEKCSGIEECNVGCCIDKEGYCLANYLHGNCISSYGTNRNRDCSDIVFCRNITDKSYASRLYSIKGKKGAGVPALKPAADYYNSSFNIRYYLYDKANILSVVAELRDSEQLVDSITLYDDGLHNDGTENDNTYGNNWLSSKIKDFDGFKRLDVDILLKYSDGTKQSASKVQSIIVLNNNKCLPIYAEWSNSSGRKGIIFAAHNYDTSSDGYQIFETDVENFLDTLFSTGKFSSNKEEFNIYRFDQSLSYSNIQALTSSVSGHCPSYSNKKDLIVLLDINEDYCIQESLGVVRTNPQAIFYKNITNAEINNTFADFCSFVLTPKKLADEIIAFAAPPKIVFYTPDNISYDTSVVNVSFGISALNYPVNYSLFLDDSIVSEKTLSEDGTESVVLDLANGTNVVFVESVDKNSNSAFAQLLLNVTLQ
ncbi:hypothetical protein HYX04_00055 [Candidatus Woesearchaeota archaeon]|nr:hypothetical protein [Candidatus Woesearchaeota archaeon]